MKKETIICMPYNPALRVGIRKAVKMNLLTELKSNYTWYYDEDKEYVRISYKGNRGIRIPRVKVRSLLCFLNRVAWRGRKKKKPLTKSKPIR